MGHLATTAVGLDHLVMGTTSLCCCPQSCPAPSLGTCGYRHVSASWRAGPSHTVCRPPGASPPWPGVLDTLHPPQDQAPVQPL